MIMIQESDISSITQDLRKEQAFNRDSFAQFFKGKMGLRLDDYASDKNFQIQLTDCLFAIYQEGRLPELLIKASAYRPGNEAIQHWAEKATIIERAKTNPRSIVTLGGTKIFIGRDDLKQKLGNNLKNRQSWVMQLQGNPPKCGISHCYWYIKHRASLLNDVDVKIIDIKEIYIAEKMDVTPYHLATTILDKLNLDIELPIDDDESDKDKNKIKRIKTQRFLDRFVGVMSQKKNARILLFIDQFRDAGITEEAKGFIVGLINKTKELDNVCVVTSLNEPLDSDELQQLDVVRTDNFTESELRDFLKNLYEELPIYTGRPNEDSEQEFVEKAMENLKKDLVPLPNVEALGESAKNLFLAVIKPKPNI